jgi:hypothetical protein
MGNIYGREIQRGKERAGIFWQEIFWRKNEWEILRREKRHIKWHITKQYKKSEILRKVESLIGT